VPETAAVKEARELIRQAFEDLFQDGERNPGPLIEKLLASVGQTDDPARKYALLLEAEDIATAAGDIRWLLDVTDMRARTFGGKPLEMRLDVLRRLMTPKTKSDPGRLDKLYEHTLDLVDSALVEDDLATAKAATGIAASLAKSISTVGRARKDPRVFASGEAKQAEAKDLMRTVDARSKAVADYTTALKTLEEKPDDPRANRMAGMYVCFVAKDWGKGLLYLAKSDNLELAEFAATEVALMNRDSDPKLVFELAGKWWSLAEAGTVDGNLGDVIKLHAAGSYDVVQRRLVDPLDRALAEKRAAEAAPIRKRARRAQMRAPAQAAGQAPTTAWTTGSLNWLVIGRDGTATALLGSAARASLAIPNPAPLQGKWIQASPTDLAVQFDQGVTGSCRLAGTSLGLSLRNDSGGMHSLTLRQVSPASSVWLFPDGVAGELRPDGSVATSRGGGQWRMVDNKVTITWSAGNMTVLEPSADGKRLEGADQQGAPIVLIRVH
jgi:hypothetical protein